MPITHPALPPPPTWRYVLSCGHTFTGPAVPDVGKPVMCKAPDHGAGDTGVMVSIVQVSRQ